MEIHKSKNQHRIQSGLKLLALIAIVFSIVTIARYFDVAEHLNQLTKWIESLGVLAPVVFIIVYIGATVALLPASVLTVAAGALFGSFYGFLYVMVGAIIGLAAAFLVARYVARDLIKQSLGSSPRFQKLDSMVEKHGTFIVALTRLIPLFPFNALNYMFGMTKIPFSVYLKWSALCIAPGTLLYVSGADALTQTLREGEVPWLLVLFIIFVAAIVAGLVRYAKKQIQQPSSNKENPRGIK